MLVVKMEGKVGCADGWLVVKKLRIARAPCPCIVDTDHRDGHEDRRSKLGMCVYTKTK